MPTFFFWYRVKPLPNSPIHGNLAGGLAHIFVSSPDLDTAEESALAYMQNSGWEIIEEIDESPRLMHRGAVEYDRGLLTLFDRAQKNGIACEIVAGISDGKIWN